MFVRTDKQVSEMLLAVENSLVVSFDIETNGLNPWQRKPEKAKINLVGVGTEDGEYSFPVSLFPEDESEDIVRDLVSEMGNGQVVVMQSGKFDSVWMKVHYGIELPFHFDTMLAAYILDENRFCDLESLAYRYFGVAPWDIDLRTKKGMSGDWKKLSNYHSLDLKYTRSLYFPLKRELANDLQVKRVFDKILMPLARMFIDVQIDGICVDYGKFEEVEKKLRGDYDRALEELKTHADINWASTKQLGELLFDKLKLPVIERTKKGGRSVSESVIKRLDHPCTDALLRFRSAKQQLSFFIDGWKPHIHKKRVNGKWEYYLHPSVKLNGTVTGRPSCENPNLYQVPRDPFIRSLITAEDGWTHAELDLSQIELRIAAELANERTMLQAFHEGADVHWLTALREIERGGGLRELVMDTAAEIAKDPSLTYGESIQVLLKAGPDKACEVNSEWKEYRKKAKAINFGYLYGMWWKKFKEYARDNYGVKVTDEQAKASREFYFSTYSGLEAWHKRQKKFAREYGYVASLSGRKRRLPDAMLLQDCPAKGQAERQAINSPVQSFANEINFMSALQIRKEFGPEVLKVCGTVYDALLLRIRNDSVIPVVDRLLEIMSRPPMFDEFGIELSVPILAEAKIGPWGAGIDYHKWRAKQCSKSVKAK